MALKYCDGERLRRVLLASNKWLSSKSAELNAINVFPVADGDTGTNMALTLQATAAAVMPMRSTALSEVADAMARSSLIGARGNSGVILSQYLSGFASAIRGRKRAFAKDLAAAFEQGTISAYEAIETPKEGTILTVFREAGDYFKKWSQKTNDLVELMDLTLERAKRSLAETKYKLEVLMDSDVVDAGGQGFVHMLEAVVKYIKNGDIKIEKENSHNINSISISKSNQPNKHYCCEFIIKAQEYNRNGLRKDLKKLGNSLIIAADKTTDNNYLIKVHIHSDNPLLVEETFSSYGSVAHRKVDDLFAQNQAIRDKQNESITLKKVVKIVTDSTADIPLELIEEYGIGIVPLKIRFGEKEYRDGIDMDSESFLEKLSESSDFPITSQPPSEEFRSAYDTLLEDKSTASIISIHLSSGLSGTYNSAKQGAKASSNPKHISIFDSKSISLGLGLMVLEAARMAKESKTVEEILERLEYMRDNSGIYFTVDTFEYLVKGGRIGKAKGFVGNLLNLKPILKVSDGSISAAGKVRGKSKVINGMISLLHTDIPDTATVRFAVGSAGADLRELSNTLQREFNVKPELTVDLCPVITAHTGPGTLGVFYFIEREN